VVFAGRCCEAGAIEVVVVAGGGADVDLAGDKLCVPILVAKFSALHAISRRIRATLVPDKRRVWNVQSSFSSSGTWSKDQFQK
jgi:hypothetical protein